MARGSRAIGEETPEGYLEAGEIYVKEMFAGGRAGLLPIYDMLLAAATKTGHRREGFAPVRRSCRCIANM